MEATRRVWIDVLGNTWDKGLPSGACQVATTTNPRLHLAILVGEDSLDCLYWMMPDQQITNPPTHA